MEVQLTPNQERLIAEALRSGRYRDATEVLDDALQVLKAERLTETAPDSERLGAIERLRRFGRTHGLSLGKELTVKDLINEGRR